MLYPVSTSTEVVLSVPAYSDLANLAFGLRREVFMLEQGISHADEYDDLDRVATHFVLVLEGNVAATLRVLYLPEHVKLGRFAVRKNLRGRGVGGRLFRAVIDTIKAGGGDKIALEAQIDKTRFYEKFGFHAYGEEYLDAGIVHRRMKNYRDDTSQAKSKK
ncbi:MAG TPA: GNAT family N-acetyltransferase [Dongiaceae bacterium]|nr:GNAT family N-acetyltransferase [Dongiaceae bacterium]